MGYVRKTVDEATQEGSVTVRKIPMAVTKEVELLDIFGLCNQWIYKKPRTAILTDIH